MKIKRNCIFVLDKEPNNTDAKIRYRIKWEGYTIAFGVGYRADVAKWSTDTQRCKISTTHGKKKVQASVINKAIETMENKVEEVFTLFEIRGQIPTPEEVKREYNILCGKTEREETSFFDVFEAFITTAGKQNSWSRTTFQKFNILKNQLKEFNDKLVLNELTEDILHDFVEFLHSPVAMQMSNEKATTGMKNTTVAKKISYLRWFLRWAKHKNYYDGQLHDSFKPKLKGVDGNAKEIIYLTMEEVIHLYNFQFKESRLEVARDVFIFMCFTGLRYSDVAKLKRTDIFPDHIFVVTQKTADGIKIELNNISQAILNKYKKMRFKNNLALPIVSNQKMNEALKEMGYKAGIKSPQRIVYFRQNERIEEVHPKYSLLSCHCGRRTFVVNGLYLGIPPHVIMEWTGHYDYKSMKPYIKVVDKLKEKEMTKFNISISE